MSQSVPTFRSITTVEPPTADIANVLQCISETSAYVYERHMSGPDVQEELGSIAGGIGKNFDLVIIN